MSKPAAAEAEKKELKVTPILEGKIREESYLRTRYVASVPQGTNPKDLLDPTFWRNIGHILKPMDIIAVSPEDLEWYAEYFVVGAARLWAKVHMISHHDLTPAKADMPLTDDKKYAVEWKGPTAKFAVIRKSDNAILKDGFGSVLEGHQWLDGHLKSMAA